jgi:outer membrane protein TolC
MNTYIKPLLAILLATIGHAGAAELTPELPPSEIVARVLRSNPGVQASAGQIRVEEAHRTRLEAGSYEWNVRLGGQQRRVRPASAANEHFNEWNAAIERPIRLPGKGSLDAELGAAGVALAETAYGDMLHETSRNLLKAWFVWLKEGASAAQWSDQAKLLEQQNKSVSRRQQLGDAARLESVQSEAALAQAEAQLAQAKVREQTAAEELRRRYPGLPLQAPARLGEPAAIEGSEEDWINALLEHSHELLLARQEAQRAQTLAGRSSRDRLPDPTFGLQVSRERAGEEHVVGAYVSIPLPGTARRASSDAALAQADVAGRREAAATQKITAEAVTLYQSAQAAVTSWQASRLAAERLGKAADMTSRAHQLGEIGRAHV